MKWYSFQIQKTNSKNTHINMWLNPHSKEHYKTCIWIFKQINGIILKNVMKNREPYISQHTENINLHSTHVSTQHAHDPKTNYNRNTSLNNVLTRHGCTKPGVPDKCTPGTALGAILLKLLNIFDRPCFRSRQLQNHEKHSSVPHYWVSYPNRIHWNISSVPYNYVFSCECSAECRAHKQCPFCAVTLHFLHLDTFLFCFCSSLFRVHISPLYALNIRLGVPRQHNIPVSGNPSHKDSSKRRVRIHSEQSVTRNSRRLIQRLLMTNDNRVLHCAFSQRNLGPTRPNYEIIQYAVTLTVTTATN